MTPHESHIAAARKLVADAKKLGVTHVNVTRVFQSPSMHSGEPDGACMYRINTEKAALNTCEYMYRAIETVEYIASLELDKLVNYIQVGGCTMADGWLEKWFCPVDSSDRTACMCEGQFGQVRIEASGSELNELTACVIAAILKVAIAHEASFVGIALDWANTKKWRVTNKNGRFLADVTLVGLLY